MRPYAYRARHRQHLPGSGINHVVEVGIEYLRLETDAYIVTDCRIESTNQLASRSHAEPIAYFQSGAFAHIQLAICRKPGPAFEYEFSVNPNLSQTHRAGKAFEGLPERQHAFLNGAFQGDFAHSAANADTAVKDDRELAGDAPGEKAEIKIEGFWPVDWFEVMGFLTELTPEAMFGTDHFY